jgi:hypothetical protein
VAGPLLFYARRRDFFEETKLLGSLQLLDSQVLRPNDGCDTAVRRIVTPAFALDDMWTVAKRIIVDVYGKIAGISTVLAGLMSAVAVVGAKLSNNQHKVDQAWDWLKRIWIAWMIINGIGAFIAYVTPLFSGLATLTP